jgi:hypothetical protein
MVSENGGTYIACEVCPTQECFEHDARWDQLGACHAFLYLAAWPAMGRPESWCACCLRATGAAEGGGCTGPTPGGQEDWVQGAATVQQPQGSI